MCYWRFKNEQAYRFGYATPLSGNLWRMGLYNGDTTGGFIVDETEVETKSY